MIFKALYISNFPPLFDKKRSLVSTIKEFNPVHNTTKDCLKNITDAIRNSIPNACDFKGNIISKW